MTLDAANSFRTDDEDFEVVNNFDLLGLTINNKEMSSQEIFQRLAPDSDEEAFEKILRCDATYKDPNCAGNHFPFMENLPYFSSHTLWEQKLDFEEVE